jgi:hypothetical protein
MIIEMRWSLVVDRLRKIFFLMVLGFFIACGGDAEPAPTGDLGLINPDGTGADTGPAPTQVATTVESPLYKNKKFYMETHRPVTCQGATPCPGVVLVPPGLESGEEYFEGVAAQLAASANIVVFVYNPQGRGIGSNKSAGEEDFNGVENRGLLFEVLKRAKLLSSVNKDKLGVMSFGWGLAVSASALNGSLGIAGQSGKFLIDVEGAVTRCDITVAPFTATDDVVINGDGEGVTPARCNLCGGTCADDPEQLYCLCQPSAAVDCGSRDMPRACKYPEGASDQVPPTAYVCNENVDVLSQSGMNCTDDSWWSDREPIKFLPNVIVPYHRIQFSYDHALPSAHGGREAYQWVLTGPSGIYRQYNNLGPNLPLPDVESCVGLCELDFSEGNGFGSNPFAAGASDYRPMSKSVLFTKVLPLYVTNILTKL